MKQLLLVITISICAFTTNAQTKKDTTVSITITLDQYRAILSTIDSNIDSKKVSSDLLSFIQKATRIVEDRPKEIIKK